MWRRFPLLTVAALLTGAAGVSAQIYAPATLERDFRIEWQVTHDKRGPAVEGYVFSRALRDADRMILEIERLDGAGKVLGRSTVWVLGRVPMGGRAYFKAPVPDAAGYRVQVLSLDFVGGGGGSGGM